MRKTMHIQITDISLEVRKMGGMPTILRGHDKIELSIFAFQVLRDGMTT